MWGQASGGPEGAHAGADLQKRPVAFPGPGLGSRRYRRHVDVLNHFWARGCTFPFALGLTIVWTRQLHFSLLDKYKPPDCLNLFNSRAQIQVLKTISETHVWVYLQTRTHTATWVVSVNYFQGPSTPHCHFPQLEIRFIYTRDHEGWLWGASPVTQTQPSGWGP